MASSLIIARPQTDGGLKTNLNLWVFMDAFSLHVWVALSLMLMVASAATVLVQTFNRGPLDSGTLARPFLLLIQLDYDRQETRASERLLFLVASTFSYVVFASYCALLTATMSSSAALPDLSDFGKIMREDYQLIINTGSLLEQYLANSAVGTPGYEIYHKTVKGNPDAFFGVVDAAKDMLLANPKSLALNFEPTFYADPRFMLVPGFRESVLLPSAYALAKDSEFTELFRYSSDFSLSQLPC